LNIILVIAAPFFLWALLYKPEYIAVLLFSMIIGDVNLDVPGMPLNLRAIVSICLLGRILMKKQEGDQPPFIMANFTFIVIIFFLYSMITTWANGLLDFGLFKVFITTFISAYIGYYFFNEKGNTSLMEMGLIFGGLICVADLAYTYMFVGSFPVNRLMDVYSGKMNRADFEPTNHNFFAYVCAMCFVFFFSEFMHGRIKNKLKILVLPTMFLGTVMSTGRTGLIVLIVVSLYVMFDIFRSSKEGSRRVFKFVSVIVLVAFAGILLFSTFSALFNLKSTLAENITARFVDEPIAVINKHLGFNYNVNALNSMEWREEANDVAFSAFAGLTTTEQVFGIGTMGFYARDFGHGYNAHNGILLLLIEGGIVAFVIYYTLIVLLFWKVRKLKLKSSAFVVLNFILIFTISNNNEMTSAMAFMIIGTLMAELEYKSRHQDEIPETTQS
jgi:hypothetical protein